MGDAECGGKASGFARGTHGAHDAIGGMGEEIATDKTSTEQHIVDFGGDEASEGDVIGLGAKSTGGAGRVFIVEFVDIHVEIDHADGVVETCSVENVIDGEAVVALNSQSFADA